MIFPWLVKAMRESPAIVEQVTRDGLIELGHDQILSSSEVFSVLHDFFPNLHKETVNGINILVGNLDGKTYAIRCKNISYLGYPHPEYKKRIQISDDLFSFYDCANSIGAVPILLGLYQHNGLVVFCDFSIETYVRRKAHNSSAHVYSSDLAAAVRNGIYKKTDYTGNDLTIFKSERTIEFLNSKLLLKDIDLRPEIIRLLDSFFTYIPLLWQGIDVYSEMVSAQYRNAYQSEWGGFDLEYLFEQFFNKTGTGHFRYEQDKKRDGIDLDLFFPRLNTYGDLKCHSSSSSGIQGNDLETVKSIINDPSQFRSIYYIVLEHKTEMDRDHNYIVTEYWNRLLNKSDLHSYGNRMKYSIEPIRYFLLDINRTNEQYLSIFNQGRNSNGQPRRPKIMIKNDSLGPFLLHSKILNVG